MSLKEMERVRQENRELAEQLASQHYPNLIKDLNVWSDKHNLTLPVINELKTILEMHGIKLKKT